MSDHVTLSIDLNGLEFAFPSSIENVVLSMAPDLLSLQ
jgi:hypothetical protein